MGIGYAVSALHRIGYLDLAAAKGGRENKSSHQDEQQMVDLLQGFANPKSGKIIREVPPLRYSATEAVVAWRDRLSAKYHSQLTEALIWNEASAFEESQDTAISGEIMLRYVAALADEGGLSALLDLLRMGRPTQEVQTQVLARAEQRGYTGRYPQLLLVEQYWLPFKRDMIIEEPDWEGRAARFGSAPNLLRDVAAVRDLIRRANPDVVRWTAEDDVPANPLAAAWQASETVHRLAKLAVARHLPLWCST